MKKYIKFNILAVLLLGFLMVTSCETDFDNVNSASADEVFNSREGLFAVTTGMTQLYSTAGIQFLIETSAITTREVAINSTFLSLIELEMVVVVGFQILILVLQGNGQIYCEL